MESGDRRDKSQKEIRRTPLLGWGWRLGDGERRFTRLLLSLRSQVPQQSSGWKNFREDGTKETGPAAADRLESEMSRNEF